LSRNITSSGTSLTTYAFGVEEHTYSATGTNTGNTYYYSLGGHLIGELTGTSSLVTQFFLTDALGSVLASFSDTPNSATVLGNQVYGPYGNQRYLKGAMGTAKGYTGQYADPTGLDYYNARYYDPVAGVFLSADSKQGNAQGMNPYAYVAGNPETFTDPSGHMPAPPCEQCSFPVDDAGNPLPPQKANGVLLQSPIDPEVYHAPHVAADLAKQVKKYRAAQPDRANRYNMAWGQWYITDPEGNYITQPVNMTTRPVKGTEQGGHSEPIILWTWLSFQGKDAINALLAELAKGILAQLHLVIFTQIAPCGGCQNQFHLFMLELTDILNAAIATRNDVKDNAPVEPTSVVTLDVFGSAYDPQKRNPTDTSQAAWPGTTDTYGVTDYWNGDITLSKPFLEPWDILDGVEFTQ
jgi:RHS repeat-associated protein